MAALDDIKSGIDLGQVASMLGIDAETASHAVDTALTSLLGAMEGNVANADSALGLAQAALKDHSNDLADGAIDLTAADPADGQSILNHVFDSPDQIQALGGVQGGLLRQLMPLLAPFVMAYIAKKLNGAMSGAASGGSAGSGSIIGDLLGGLLGGGQTAAPQQRQAQADSGSILGDILGSVLGVDEPQVSPQQAPAQSPFNVPSSGTGQLRIDDTTGVQQQQTSAQAEMPGLGDILRQILVGR